MYEYAITTSRSFTATERGQFINLLPSSDCLGRAVMSPPNGNADSRDLQPGQINNFGYLDEGATVAITLIRGSVSVDTNIAGEMLSYVYAEQYGVRASASGAENRSALAALAASVRDAGGGTIILPPGVIDVSSGVPVYSKVKWQGRGRKITTVRSATRTAFTVVDNTDLNDIGFSSMTITSTVDDSLLETPESLVAGLISLDGGNIDWLTVEDVEFYKGDVGNGAYTNGILTSVLVGKVHDNIVVRKCTFNCRRIAGEFFNHNNSTYDLRNVTIEDNEFLAGHDIALSISGRARNTKALRNWVYGNSTGDTGIEIAGQQRDVEVAGNWFDGTFSSLIVFSSPTATDQCSGAVVQGNQTNGRVTGRLFFQKCGPALIAHNHMLLSTSNGFEFASAQSSGCRIMHNHIDCDGGDFAVVFDDSDNHCLDFNYIANTGAANDAVIGSINGATGNVARFNTIGNATAGVYWSSIANGLKVYNPIGPTGLVRTNDQTQSLMQGYTSAGSFYQQISSGSAVTKTVTMPSVGAWLTGILTIDCVVSKTDNTHHGYSMRKVVLRYVDGSAPVVVNNTEYGAAESGLAVTLTLNSGSPGNATLTATSTVAAGAGNDLVFMWEISWTARFGVEVT